MESDKGGLTSFGHRVLSKEDLEKLPDGVRSKYELFFAEFLEMKALYETQKTNLGELYYLFDNKHVQKMI